ncbi:MAG TPA: MFS transporter [Myxococcota bacterium]|nr:MFS transporter [Myxococcota bacterium]
MSQDPSPPAYRSVRQNPWWIPPFLGGVPQGVARAHLRVLGFVTLAMFFENYDLGMFGNALPQIAATFGLDKAAQGAFTAWTRFGALPAFLLLPLADRIGRRRILLLAIAGMSAGSLATALAQSPAQFVAAQLATRTCIVAAAIASFVVVSEEFPARHRGWGIGMLGGVGAIGYGFGALCYGTIQWLPFGWRALYAFGIAPLALLPAFARGMRETARFAAISRSAGAAPGALSSLSALLREHPRRALAIALISGLASAGTGPSFQFVSEFLQTERGWRPSTFAALTFVFGAFAIVGNPVAGRLGDRYGRRRVAATVLALFPLASLGFFAGPPAWVALPWTLMVFLWMATTVSVRTLATELFPTALRGTGAGSLALLETVGVGTGLLIYAAAVGALGSQSIALPLVALACLGAAASVYLVPETARRELEEVS